MWFIILATMLLAWFYFSKFSTSVQSNTSGKRVVKLHFTNWCTYCKRMKPIWQSAKLQLPGVIFQENDEDIKKTKGIKGYPTIILTRENGTVSQYNGQANEKNLVDWIVSN